MMVDPWIVIIGCFTWIAVGAFIFKACERDARRWEKASGEWRSLAIAHAAAARYWQACALNRNAVEVHVATSSGLDGLTATQLGETVH